MASSVVIDCGMPFVRDGIFDDSRFDPHIVNVEHGQCFRQVRIR